MNRKQFTIYRVLICAVTGALLGYAVSLGNTLLTVIAIVIGIILLNLGRRRVTEVIEDERIYRISEKASRKTLEIFGVSIALIGVSLIALNKYVEAGCALAFSVCALTLLYLTFYSYYSRKSLG